MPQRKPQAEHVEALDRPPDKARLARVGGVLGLEEPGAEHGCHRERDEHAHQDRERHHVAEAAEEAADPPAHEDHRDEDDQQREGRGDDRQRDLLSGARGGLAGPQPIFLHVPEDVFVDDHGVVDHDADREDQPQHGDVVEREAHRVHEREGGDHRCRDGERGDERRPPVAHEEQDRQADEDGGQEQVGLDLVDRVLDEPRLVADDLDVDVVGQDVPDFLQPVFDPLDHGDGVGARLLLHDQAHGQVARPPGVAGICQFGGAGRPQAAQSPRLLE